MSDNHNRKRKRNVVDDQLPPINSLSDLIRLSERETRHININMEALWEIKHHLIELDSLIGMESVKTTILKQVIYYLQGLHLRDIEGEYLHTQIVGPPGTGKTTVAEIIGRIFRDLGILSPYGVMRIIHRDDLIAGYVGQTALKTREVLNSMLGGVLFLDEAYSMGCNDHENGDVFAKEAIDTITSFLSEHKEDLCFIIAGYEEDINRYFFSLNKGLERRFQWKHKIEPYKPDELAEIMIKKVKDSRWECAIPKDEITLFIQQNKEYFKNAGGDIENLLSKCKIAHSHRVFTLSADAKFRITKEDILEGLRMMKENALNDGKQDDKEKLTSMYS